MHKPLLIYSAAPLLQKDRFKLNFAGGFLNVNISSDIYIAVMIWIVGFWVMTLWIFWSFRRFGVTCFSNLKLRSEQIMDVVDPVSRVGWSNEDDGPNFVVPYKVVSPQSFPVLQLVILFLIMQDESYLDKSAW